MKTRNILKLVDASIFSHSIKNETFNALCNFYEETGATLDNINVDNDIVNGITESTITEFKKYYESFDEVVILSLNEEENFIAYWN